MIQRVACGSTIGKSLRNAQGWSGGRVRLIAAALKAAGPFNTGPGVRIPPAPLSWGRASLARFLSFPAAGLAGLVIAATAASAGVAHVSYGPIAVGGGHVVAVKSNGFENPTRSVVEDRVPPNREDPGPGDRCADERRDRLDASLGDLRNSRPAAVRVGGHPAQRGTPRGPRPCAPHGDRGAR